MVHPLIGFHAALGEIGVFAFIWVFVEILNPTEKRTKRATIAAFLGVLLFLSSWFTGGYYYVEYYGVNVKPIIKEGPQPWAHSIITEAKEHIFLFLPFLSILAFGLIYNNREDLREKKEIKNAILLLSGFIVLIGLSMAGMGYIISTAARLSYETGVGVR